jgi:hypothetical protein
MSELPLKVLNLCAKGMSIKDAQAIYNKGRNTEAEKPADGKPKKLTLDERKQALAEQITAAGGTVPATNASIAKFNEALTAAETPKEDSEETSLY